MMHNLTGSQWRCLKGGGFLQGGMSGDTRLQYIQLSEVYSMTLHDTLHTLSVTCGFLQCTDSVYCHFITSCHCPLQLVCRGTSRPRRGTTAVCSVPATVAPLAREPPTVCAAPATTVPTLTHRRCLAPVCIIILLDPFPTP